jgi:hypothetical protein
MTGIGEAELRAHFGRRSIPSERELRRDLAEDARRVEANRGRCPRAVAVERLLTVAIEHERSSCWADRMPMPAFEELERMLGEVSDAARSGQEVSKHAQAEAVRFLHEHVKNPAALIAKVAATVGA